MPSGALASRPIAPAMVIPIPTRAGESPTVRVRNRAQQVYQAPLPKLVISVAHMRRRTDACPGGASASPDSRGVLATHVMRRGWQPCPARVDCLAYSYNLPARVRVDLTAEDLAATHFSMSPLFETIEALRTLRDPGRRALHLPWVRWAERELAATPLELPRVWPLLIEPYRQPEFLMPAPRSRLPDLEQELRQLLATTPSQVRAAVARLLGERRAQLLVLLRAPHTTAELARRLQVTPSAVSQHLSALRHAGLISSEHLGRQHLHMTSQLGQQLLRLQQL